MKQPRGFQTVIVIWALLGPFAFASQDVNFTSSPLKGIKTLTVLVEKLSEDATKIGLTKGKIQTTAELILRREGIVIGNSITDPCIYIKITVIGSAYSIRAEIREGATLTRIPIFFTVTTWYAESTGTHGGNSSHIIVALQERLDGFVNDYYKANPKK